MPVPHMWDRVVDDFSRTWLGRTAERQKAIDHYVKEGDIEALIKQHSSPAEDPCNIQSFRISQPDHSSAYIIELTQQARDAQAQTTKIAEKACTRVDHWVRTANQQELDGSAEQLRRLQEARVADVSRISELLGEIADPKRHTSQSQVLASKHGNAVAQMSREQRDAEYKSIRERRIAVREEVTFNGAVALLQEAGPPRELKKLLEEEKHADELERQGQMAAEKESEVHPIVSSLQEALERSRKQLANCRDRKLAVSEALDNKRAVLKEALSAVRAAEEDYQDLNVEHEVLREQIVRLESSVSTNEAELAAGRQAAQPAVSACEAWMTHAAQNEQRVRDCVLDGAQTVGVHASKYVENSAMNIRLAIDWLTKALKDKGDEIDSLAQKKAAHEMKLRQLTQQMTNPDEDFLMVQNMCARKKDEVVEVQAEIDSCKQKRTDMQAALQKANGQLDTLESLQRYGCTITAEVAARVRAEAESLSASSYEVFPLWFKGLTRIAPEEPPRSPSVDVLDTIGWNQADVQKYVCDQVKVMMQQMKLDMEVRGRRTATNSDVVSDNDDWVKDFAGPERYNIGDDTESMAEGAASSSAAGTTHGGV